MRIGWPPNMILKLQFGLTKHWLDQLVPLWHLISERMARWGLALNANVGLVLKAGDRIENIEGFHDVLDVKWENFLDGTRVTFFRSKQCNRLIHWCPLVFDTTFGNPVLEGWRIVGDVLHTVDAGVAQYAGGSNFAFMLEHSSETLMVTKSTKAVMEKSAMDNINARLNAFYLTQDARGLEHMTDVVKQKNGRFGYFPINRRQGHAIQNAFFFGCASGASPSTASRRFENDCRWPHEELDVFKRMVSPCQSIHACTSQRDVRACGRSCTETYHFVEGIRRCHTQAEAPRFGRHEPTDGLFWKSV